MERKKITQRLTSLLLVLLMFFGAVFPSELAFAAGTERPKVKITNFTITDTAGNPPGPNGFNLHARARLNIKWDASDYLDQLKEGDYFNLVVPSEFTMEDYANLNFPIKDDSDNLVANGFITVNPNGGMTVKVVFTNFVENKVNIKGNIHLDTKFMMKNILPYLPLEKEVEVSIGENKASALLKVQKPQPVDKHMSKWAQMKENGNVYWSVRINVGKFDLHNVVISDKITYEDGDVTTAEWDGIRYVPGTFILEERLWDEYANSIPPGIVSSTNVSDQVQIAPDGKSFTYTMGDTNGKQYMLHYETTYIKGRALKVRNNVSRACDDPEFPLIFRIHIFTDQLSGGGGQADLKNKIQIVKVDAENNQIRLADAVFQITKPNGQTFKLTTNLKGEALSDELIPGTYKVKEITPPSGYELNPTEKTVVVKSGEPTRVEFDDNPIKIDIKATKTWENADDYTPKPTIKFELWRKGGTAEEGEKVKGTAQYPNPQTVGAGGEVNFGKQRKTDVKGESYFRRSSS